MPITSLAALMLAGSTLLATDPSALPDADTLIARSIAYHDPDNRLLTQGHHLWFRETRPNGPDRHTEVRIDIPAERFDYRRQDDHTITGQLTGAHCTLTLDGRSELTDAERETHRLSCERLARIRNYYTYLWALPMKLRDPGTRLGAVTETTFDGEPVYGLRVTYDEAVGEDVWYVYFDRESFALEGYRFYHDEAKNDGEYILLEGETTAEGLRIPKRRTWYTHQDDRLLGTDTLLRVAPIDRP